MRRSKLSDHTFQKGKFITPINAIPLMHELEDEKSWTYGRMPEYLWIGLILKYYGRDEGLESPTALFLHYTNWHLASIQQDYHRY